MRCSSTPPIEVSTPQTNKEGAWPLRGAFFSAIFETPIVPPFEVEKKLLMRTSAPARQTVRRALCTLLCAASVVPTLHAQSARHNRDTNYGANISLALYYFEQAKSKPIDKEIHLPTTFSEASQERTYLTNQLGLEEVGLRQVISVGLKAGEQYATGEKFGEELLNSSIEVKSAEKGATVLALSVRYGNKVLLDAPAVRMENFETVALRGGEAMFALKTFVGPNGPETVPASRTLLATITVQVDLEGRLQNRPYDLSHMVDQFGAPVQPASDEQFTPPVVLVRLIPVLPATRRVPLGVLLDGIVTPEGKIINVRVLRGADTELDKIAVDSLRRFEFRPAALNGKPVYSTFRQEINFVSPQPLPPPRHD